MTVKRPFDIHSVVWIPLTWLLGCVTPLTDIVTEDPVVLVVEGFITDEPGPHEVQVTFFNPINPNQRPLNGLPQALVSVIEVETGAATTLERRLERRRQYYPPDIPGPPVCFIPPFYHEGLTPYLTPSSFQGVVGNSYYLEIKFGGEVFRSEAQRILPTPDIDSVLLDFVDIPSVDRDRPGSGVEVYASWQDPPETNYYFWRVDGIYRIDTRYIPQPTSLENSACFCPFDISDRRADGCWIHEDNLPNNEIAFSDAELNGKLVTLPVGLVVDDGVRFREGKDVDPERLYHVDVAQHVMSEEAFLYNERIKILKEIDGEIFDPAPLDIKGNLYNIEDEEDLIIGFFGAYAVKRKGAFIKRNMLEFTQTPSTLICGDCRAREGAQEETPEPFLQNGVLPIKR